MIAYVQSAESNNTSAKTNQRGIAKNVIYKINGGLYMDKTIYYLTQPLEGNDIVELAKEVAEVLNKSIADVAVEMRSKGGEE